jgi:hypothetical protein
MTGRRLGDVANGFLFENDRVRVWQMDLAPGESSDFHEHTLPDVNRSEVRFREILVELKG